MIITWLGHSCFKIEAKGQSLVLDPFADGSVEGLKNIRETANMVLCSHHHGDHDAVENVRIVPVEESIFTVEKLESYHDDVKGAKRGRNTIHIINAEGYRIAHLGDLGCELNEEQINKLQELDVLLIPVGGFFTIDAAQAGEIVRQLKPRITIPMHYRGEGFGFGVLGTVKEFVKQFENVRYEPFNTLEVTAEPENEVVVLHVPD